MKYSFFLLLLAANFAKGQKLPQLYPRMEFLLDPQTQVQNDSIYGEFKNLFGDKNLKFRLDPEKPDLTFALQGRFSHKAGYGTSIYIIPLDHLACSVPDRLADEKMLSRRPENFQDTDPMPNGLPEVQIIPVKKTGKNPFAAKFSAK